MSYRHYRIRKVINYQKESFDIGSNIGLYVSHMELSMKLVTPSVRSMKNYARQKIIASEKGFLLS